MSATSVSYELLFRKYIEKEYRHIWLKRNNRITESSLNDLAKKFCLSFFKAYEIVGDYGIVVLKKDGTILK